MFWIAYPTFVMEFEPFKPAKLWYEVNTADTALTVCASFNLLYSISERKKAVNKHLFMHTDSPDFPFTDFLKYFGNMYLMLLLLHSSESASCLDIHMHSTFYCHIYRILSFLHVISHTVIVSYFEAMF